MSDRARRGTVVVMVVGVTALLGLYLALLPTIGPIAAASSSDPGQEWPVVLGSYLSFLVGAVVVYLKPRNPIGWLLMCDAGFSVYAPLVILVTWLRQFVDDGNIGLRLLAWSGNWIWILAFAGFIYTFLLFPAGRYLSSRWRRLGRFAAFVLAAQFLVTALVPYVETAPDLVNPFGLAALGQADPVIGGLAVAMLALVAASGLSLILRYVRSTGVERLQLKWVAYAVAISIPLVIMMAAGPALLDLFGLGSVPPIVPSLLDGTAALLGAVGIGVAVLRYRLFDIDVVVNKTLVVTSLAVFITGVYVAIVVGVGSVVGAGDEPSLVLSIVATTVVAVGFQPARRRLQRLANRLVYGQRATPYELLAGFSRQVVASPAGDDETDVLGEVCRLLVEGTGSTSASIWRDGDRGDRLVAAWPVSGDRPTAPSADAVTRLIAHDGESLGVLAVLRRAGEALSSAEAELLEHLSAGLGLLLVNTRLTDDLRRRVVELEASRARLVAAGDEVRRDIEAQVSEGPQQTLTAIVHHLEGLRQQAADAGGDRTAQMLGRVAEVVDAANRSISEFARGVFPAILEHHGLDGALRQRAEAAPLPVTVHTDLSDRYPLVVETALFFTASEALQNVARYANATSAHITVSDTTGPLTLQIVDDGDGFDPDTMVTGAGTTNMHQRLDSLGGQLTINSTLGHGTTITATVPHPHPTSCDDDPGAPTSAEARNAATTPLAVGN